MDEKTAQRSLFDDAAQDYAAVRPGYPQALIEDIIAISHLPEGGRILEVGCGTGQATLPFAQRGYAMICLDIGARLAAIAARKCLPYANVRILVSSFEDWQEEESAFDVVMSATAFHWIATEAGYAKSARILKESGYLAIFSNQHPAPYTGFFAEVQEVYRQVVPEWPDVRSRPAMEETIRSTEQQINASGLFEKVTVRQYPWTRQYPAEQYIRLLNTYSDHRQLEETRRKQLYDGIFSMITGHYGGIVTRPYMSVLHIAGKRQH